MIYHLKFFVDSIQHSSEASRIINPKSRRRLSTPSSLQHRYRIKSNMSFTSYSRVTFIGWMCCQCGGPVDPEFYGDDCPVCGHSRDDNCTLVNGTSRCQDQHGLEKQPTETNTNTSDLWICCSCGREVPEGLYQDSCPDCAHTQCSTCT